MKKYFLKVINKFKKRRSSHFDHVRVLPNVFFDTDAHLDESTYFNLEGQCKEITIGKGVVTRRFCNFLVYDNASLIIHDNVFFNNFCSINCLGKIEIGSNSIFGEGVKLYDHNHLHSYNNNIITVQRTEFKIGMIAIGKNCWVGSNVTILNNVTIGDNVIIGANALIYKSIPSNTIVKHKEELITNQY